MMHFPYFLEKQIKLLHFTLKRCKAFYFWKKSDLQIIHILELILKSQMQKYTTENVW